MSEECAECGAYFATPADLMAHVRDQHRDAATNRAESLGMNPESHRAGLVCALCGMRFSSAAALARHNAVPHRSERRFAPAASY
ncbi:MAG TPA: C2H2-type zinc finger protein [Thermoplasmata archaeon]|nr:C2H2-type zinc finger protein [Thermoplasmata archaeon]